MLKTYQVTGPMDDATKEVLVDDLNDLTGTQGVELLASEQQNNALSVVVEGVGFSDDQIQAILDKHGYTVLES